MSYLSTGFGMLSTPTSSSTTHRRVLMIGMVALLITGCGAFSADPRVRTPGTMFDDNALESVVRRAIRNSDPGFESAHLVVVVYNGVALLVGQVGTQALKQKATVVAEGIQKVRKVHNELTVGGPISFLARTNDGWLTSKVKTRLIRNPATDADVIKVQTENGVVYLMGMVPREEADAAAQAARRVYGVQKIIKVFEYPD